MISRRNDMVETTRQDAKAIKAFNTETVEVYAVAAVGLWFCNIIPIINVLRLF